MADPDPNLVRAHRTVLVLIAVCAAVAGLQSSSGDEGAPDPWITTVALALGLGVILLRGSAGSPVVSEASRNVLALCSFACAFGLAGLGAFLALNVGQPRTGLAFALAAAILCLRRPVSTAGRRSRA